MCLTIVTFKRSLRIIKNNEEAIARWISSMISPHIVGIVLVSIITLRYSDNPLEILFWLAWAVPLVVLPPLFYLFWLVYIRAIEDIYLPRRETRLRPLVVSMVWLLFCLWLLHYWAVPRMMEGFLLAVIVLVGIMSLITLFWKISFHGASISAAAITTTLMAGLGWGWMVILLVPLVGWSRIRLQRHTPRQVIYGSLLGALLALLLMNGLWQEAP